MKVDFGQQKEEAPPQPQQGRVEVSPNPVRYRVRIDINGNEIDPRTKQIIRLEKDVH